ncbi:MAG TPA: TonB-dependent receptor [Edaphobacter sp.]|nr:TonB-dependent receptor [Edaphobacter sp.]
MKLRWQALVLTVVMMGAGYVGIGFAQNTNSGDIRGTVTDTTGALIPGVAVTVVNNNTGVVKTLMTNGAGLYDTSSIVAGNYKVTFAKDGFTKLERSSITVLVGNTTVNAALSVGSVTDQVVVNTDVPLLNTDNGEQTTTLEAKTMSQLPQVGQSWENFVILLPGSSGAPGGSQGAANPGQVASVNGNLPYSTVLADGASTTLPSSANSDVETLETVQELQVSTSAFSAQYGIGGILFNQISKGGTDSFHGSLYEYFQNTALNAADYAFGSPTAKVPIQHYNNFGGSIGGPILKKKLFFYFNYDKILQHGGSANGFETVPTAAMLAGDFTGQNTIYDPATTTVINGVVHRTSFANEYGHGNVIPANRLDPVAQAIQASYPAPNSPGTVVNGITQQNFFYNVPGSNPYTKYFGRLDYDITPSNRLSMSELEGDNPQYGYAQGICPIACGTEDVSRNNAQITDVWTISSHMTNEARIGYTNQLNFFVPATLNQGFPDKLGWKFAKADNFPSINITGYYGLSSAINAVYKEHAYDPSDVVTLILGKHILHFGGEFLFYRDNSTSWGNVNAGTMNYTGDYTKSTQGDSSSGLAYADFLLGQTQKWTAAVTPEYGGRMRLPQMFVQDDYKIRPNVTLNLGLRYQIQSGWGEVKGNMRVFDPTVANPATGTNGAMWYGSTKANGRSTLQAPVYTTFLPRFGFSWQLHPNTVLRGGFGLYAYNWSLDTYGAGMGSAFGSQGDETDQSNGVAPVTILSGDGSTLPYIAATTDPSGFNGSSASYNQYHTPVGGSYQWNLSAQQELGTDMVATLTYIGNHGHNLPFPVDINQVPESKLSANDTQFRPYPQYQGISGSTNNAISNYNALQVAVQKRFTGGLNFNFNYTWAHFLDEMDSSGWGSRAGGQAYQNAYRPGANYGNSNFDVRNALKGSVVYQLPFGHGRRFLNNNWLLDEVVGGWQGSGTVVAQSGQPFTVYMNNNNSFSQAGNWFPNVIGDPHLSKKAGPHGTNQWFNEAAYAVPVAGTFGNSGRNSLNGPGLTNVNFSLGKSFAIWEEVHLQIRADASNVLNHPSFALPGSALTVADGAVATGSSTIRGVTIGGRHMQLGARLTF